MSKKMATRWLVALTLLGLTACGGKLEREAAETYARIAEASYADSLAEAKRLQTAVDAFVAAPDAAGLTAAQTAWKAAREPYGQTEVFRFYDGPIDDPENGPEGLINAWPLDEAYIDSVQGAPGAGFINDPSVALTAEAVMALNEKEGEENIATGYHAIEFMLWGQDLSETSAGTRPHTDFVSAANADRRRQYLGILSALMVQHLEEVHAAWTDGGDNYRAQFVGAKGRASLEKMLTGMIVLSGFELAGERLQTALDSGDQEDEHSCFSDNTHRDMVLNAKGVQNVWHGRYVRTDGTVIEGTGLKAVVADEDAALADALTAQIDRSVTLGEAIQAPFDREIATGNAAGRARVQAMIDSLRKQEELLFDVFKRFGLTVSIPE
ncbi:imelysin family protein [Myxococcus sp. SDU36]|uniref:imelysin family protein n=1 Tax=Myxococcus sp. SDU36 TaxID=2831967 RepID=UPI0025434B57|nr:imelysin family protein [Myxococcus sp. SDU36]WIG98843.1 iron-regulated protein [Myxococcus sp. SDU36]